jgi:signal transduction histidine kinase
MLGTFPPAASRQLRGTKQPSGAGPSVDGNRWSSYPHRDGSIKRTRRWYWALPISLLVLLPHLFGLTMVSSSEWPVETSVAILQLSTTLLSLAAGCVLCCHWWITFNRGTAWIGAALLAISIQQLPFSLVRLDATTAEELSTPYTLLDSLLAVPFLVMLLFGARGYEFRRRVTPLLLGTGVGLGLGTIRFFYTVRDFESWAGVPHAPMWTGWVVALVVGVLAAACVLRMDSLPRWARRETAVATVGLVLGHSVNLNGVNGDGRADVIANGVLMAAFVLLAITATELLLDALREHDHELEELAERAQSAEDVVRSDEERLHEVRGSVAGISSASRILLGLNAELSPAHQRRLTELLGAELDRLEALLTNTPTDPEVVELDPVIVPLVTAYRYLGLSVEWHPSGTCAWTRKHDLTEVLQVLLSNTARHAPGSTAMLSAERRGDSTLLRVRDDGPGIPRAMRDQIFDRGVRRHGSAGQGLGLYIARKIVAQNGGRLDLDTDHERRSGAAFVLQLPAREPA